MAQNLYDSSPILPRPHHLEGTGTLALEGAGQVELVLDGLGRVELQHGPRDTLRFEGQGAPRREGNAYFLEGCEGVLTLTGRELRVKVSGGRIRARLQGTFDARIAGRGLVQPARGEQFVWQDHPQALRLETASVRSRRAG